MFTTTPHLELWLNYVANKIKARAAGRLAQYSQPSDKADIIGTVSRQSQQWHHQLWDTAIILHLILTAPQV